MVLSTTQINERRRQRYKNRMNTSNKDETMTDYEKDITNRDDNINDIKSNIPEETKQQNIKSITPEETKTQNIKSITPEETKPQDIFETLYSHNYESEISFNHKSINDNHNVNHNVNQVNHQSINDEQPNLSIRDRRKSKPIQTKTKRLFERIQQEHTMGTIKDNDNEPKLTKQKPKSNIDDNSELKDKLLLRHKIKQYKLLFPEELKKYKINDSATVAKLRSHLEEIEILISLSSVDTFIMDSIFYCIKMIEGLSARTTNYNITGLADILKSNPEFIKLSKQLYLKYNTFESVPPEYQLMMVVATSTYICIQKNKNKSQINDLLNQPYVNTDSDEE
jgi:hypothetical protein